MSDNEEVHQKDHEIGRQQESLTDSGNFPSNTAVARFSSRAPTTRSMNVICYSTTSSTLTAAGRTRAF